MSQRKGNSEWATVGMFVGLCMALSGPVQAGSLDSPAAPTDPGSAMYTLEDVYNRLDTGTAGTQSVFAEPVAGPGSTGHTLNQVMSKAPVTNANAAAAAEVLTGKVYWGLKTGAWGQQTGTMANRGAVTITPGTTQQAIQQGYHSGAGYVEGDADLVTGNIRSGVNIFGVAGDANVVNTSSGDATAADILGTKKAWVDGAEVTGTVPAGGNVTGGDGALVIAIADGLYTGSKTATANDTDLATGNIRSGVNVFGVAGDANVVNTSSGDATAGDIMATKKAWVDGTEVTGTMATRTLSAANDTVQAGYYAATTLSAVDADLVTGNIKAGVNIFGVAGDANVVNTSSGDATAGDLLAGKKAWVDGGEVTGTMATRTLSAANDTVQAGYYAATTLSAVDTDLATANIKAGTTIFGVAGKTEVVDTTSGDATAADLKTGKKAWVDGSEVTGTGMPAPAPKTGQTTVYRAGDDGTYQKGVASPSPRFTDNGDGTVTDNLTGLMWTKNANIWGTINWNTAVDNCEGYSLAGYNDWRLPNVREMLSLIDYARYNPALPSGHPFTGVQSSGYTSSTTCTTPTTFEMIVETLDGEVALGTKTGAYYYVWPVRGGQ